MLTEVSFLLYILTFFCGILLDAYNVKSIYKNIFVIWLFIFLCFGYMTGSDWRGYELEYNDAKIYGITKFNAEFGFNLIYVLLAKCIPDFFLALGLLKCLYLTSLISLLKLIIDKWLAALSILMPISLLFMLIDNPLRFMVALTMVNMGIYYYIKNRIKLSYVFLLLSFLFHSTAIFFILIPFFFFYSKYIYRLNRLILIVIYIGVTFLSFNIDFLNNIKQVINLYLIQIFGIKEYSSYEIENTDSLYTIGSIIQVFIFVLILLTKDSLTTTFKSNYDLYGLSIIYLILSKLLLVIPTGFRLAIPFGYFFATYIVILLFNKKLIGYIISLYLFLTLCKDLYTSYTYIPYSNSIIPIVTQDHKGYIERSQYNINETIRRLGYDIQQK